MATKRRLGRGLDALLGTDTTNLSGFGQEQSGIPTATPVSLEIKALTVGKYQPRKNMDEQALNELADSIKSQGVMQPILVRPISGKRGKTHEIIAGERRFRAAKLAKLTHIPVIVRDADDEDVAVMALIENLQREDLNPLEEARGVRQLLDEFGLTHEQAAKAIGRSRSATSNILRLLNLSEPVQTMLIAGDIDMGHARALLACDHADQVILATEIVGKGLSVRQTEKLIGRFLRQKDQPETTSQDTKDPHRGDLKRLENALSDKLGTVVSVRVNARNKGTLAIQFHDWDHLNALLEKQGLAEVLGDESSGS